jgi:hypothetical protein
VDDIDNGKRNDQEIVAETEAEPDSDRQLDYLVYGPDGFPENCSSSPGDRWWSPQNQLGLPENHFWIPGVFILIPESLN